MRKIPGLSTRTSFIKLFCLITKVKDMTIGEALLGPDIGVHQTDIAALGEKAGDHAEQEHSQ